MTKPAIEIDGLGKRYQIGTQKPLVHLSADIPRLVSRWISSRRQATARHDVPQLGQRDLWAIRDISVQIEHGEVFGVIGSNGAGKSTLFKILARITEPTEGRAVVRGRVAALLQVGTGFHPDLTGRENIYLNGSILGLRRAEIDRQFDEIVDFADLERFIDTPLKFYSSGMKARLGFAVVSCLDSDILMLDEILSVGDAHFRERSLKRANEMVGDGRTVLFVSHNLAMVQKICNRVMLLEDGQIKAIGSAEEVVSGYLSKQVKDAPEYCWSDAEANQISGLVRPIRLTISDGAGSKRNRFRIEEPIDFTFEYEIRESCSNLRIGISLTTASGELFCVAWDDAGSDRDRMYKRKPGRYVSRCTFPGKLLSNTGFNVGIYTGVAGAERTFRDPEVLQFYIEAATTIGDLGRSLIRPDLSWHTDYLGQ
jgi:lipopolysaccharide transport system ATP-binding protein